MKTTEYVLNGREFNLQSTTNYLNLSTVETGYLYLSILHYDDEVTKGQKTPR